MKGRKSAIINPQIPHALRKNQTKSRKDDNTGKNQTPFISGDTYTKRQDDSFP